MDYSICELKKILVEKLKNDKLTLLGVGPMSQNCVDVVIDICNTEEVPIQLIASRRQIECESLGGGYVNSWTTESFSEYVKDKDKKNLVLLARDHGGPWQNYSEVEENLDLGLAMSSSKISFKADIENDFDFIHVDPSVDIKNKVSNEDILKRVEDLYKFCIETADVLNKEIFIEVGTEEQVEGLNKIEEVESNLKYIKNFCEKSGMPMPTFYVVQNGSKVKETQNTGVFQNLNLENYDKDSSIRQISLINNLCLNYGVLPKAHNSDYLTYDVSKVYPKINLKGGNIAPEFGVIETQTIIFLLKKYKLFPELEDFVMLALDSQKWVKWMKNNSKADDLEKATIAGHYIFSNKSFTALKEKIDYKLRKFKIDLDYEIKNNLDKSIKTYLKAYGW